MQETSEMIYLFIRSYMVGSDGRPPTIRDIGVAMRPDNPLSNAVVDYHLERLEAAGHILRVQLPDSKKRVIRLPGAHYVLPPMPAFAR